MKSDWSINKQTVVGGQSSRCTGYETWCLTASCCWRCGDSWYTKVNEELTRLSKEVSELQKKVSVLENYSTYRLDDLEQYQRRSNLRIFGIPESKDANTDKLVHKVVKEKLRMELSLKCIYCWQPEQSLWDGRCCHRPIIVRFTSYWDRHHIYEAKKRLKGSGVTIREDLTDGCEGGSWEHRMRNTLLTADGRINWVTGTRSSKRIYTAVRLEEIRKRENYGTFQVLFYLIIFHRKIIK